MTFLEAQDLIIGLWSTTEGSFVPTRKISLQAHKLEELYFIYLNHEFSSLHVNNLIWLEYLAADKFGYTTFGNLLKRRLIEFYKTKEQFDEVLCLMRLAK